MMFAHTYIHIYFLTLIDSKRGEKCNAHTKSERNGERVRAERDGDTPTDVRTRTAARMSTASRRGGDSESPESHSDSERVLLIVLWSAMDWRKLNKTDELSIEHA